MFALAPLMVWAGLKVAKDTPVPGYALAAAGVGTAVYNGLNYLERQREADQ